MAMKREPMTTVDWSKHELIEIQTNEMSIHHLKKPDTIEQNVKFINTNNILAVTGDYGNWIFCREFHPSKDGYVSPYYWIEKLEIYSTQTGTEYSAEETEKAIEEFESDYDSEYVNDEFEDWIERLKESVHDEIEYTQIAYREHPNDIDVESIPFEKEIKVWLRCVFDAFNEICKRIEKESYFYCPKCSHTIKEIEDYDRHGYQYKCDECGHTSEVGEVDGRFVLMEIGHEEND